MCVIVSKAAKKRYKFNANTHTKPYKNGILDVENGKVVLKLCGVNMVYGCKFESKPLLGMSENNAMRKNSQITLLYSINCK